MKVGVCEGRVKTVAMGAQRVINLDNIVDGSFELKRDKGVANPEGLICENSCEEKYTLGTLMGCEKQLTVNRESFRNHTIAKIAGPLKVKENTCKADGLTCLEDGLAMRLPLSEPREIYKDSLATDNRSNIGSECSFEIDLPGKRDRSTIYRLNLIKLYRRKPELANLVMKNSSEGIDFETPYSVKLFMDFGFQGNLRKSQLHFKLPPDQSSYVRMINAKKKERFLPGPGTIVLRQKDINLVTGKPFRIKTCCSSQMLINSLREDTEYLLDLGVNGMGQSNRTLPVVWESLVEKINAASWVTVLDLWKWYFRRSLLMNYSKHTTCVMPVGMYIIKKSRFKFLCAYDECNLTTRILRLLEPIEVPRMVDVDIRMEIWKNRVKKIDFVLKWLIRVGSEVGPTKGSGGGRRVAIMDFGAPWTIGKAYLKIIMSSFLGFCKWNTRNRWRDGQVCPDVDKELWRLGPDSPGDERTGEKKREREKEEKRARKREGLIVGGRGEENPRVLLGDADQESEMRMRKNALRTGRRQAVEGRWQRSHQRINEGEERRRSTSVSGLNAEVIDPGLRKGSNRNGGRVGTTTRCSQERRAGHSHQRNSKDYWESQVSSIVLGLLLRARSD
ncbi:uncharacterized protein TNCV_3808621 [Trichonephila clavipes]|nr:uncharacterized protein TNCV_3808621 [Trichonephila clavipes]